MACANDLLQGDDLSCEYIIMSESAKPIWFGQNQNDETMNDEKELRMARVCGLVQALRTSIICNKALGLGDLQCIRSESHCIVFMTVEAITLVAISAVNPKALQSKNETEPYLRMQLEYLYAQLISSTTTQIQAIYRQNPSYDLRTVLGHSAQTLLAATGKLEQWDITAARHTMGLAMLYPLAPELRNQISRCILETINGEALVALLVAGPDQQLVSMVQAKHRNQQLKMVDLHILLQLLKNQQQRQLNSDLWMPLCFPFLHSSGFVHCYAHCLNCQTRLTLVLLSLQGTTEQLASLRSLTFQMRSVLGIPREDLQQQQQGHDSSFFDDDDYFDVASGGMLPYLPEVYHGKPLGLQLVRTISPILDPNNSTVVQTLLREYLELAQAEHFCFRFNVPLSLTRRTGSAAAKPSSNVGCLTQFLCPSLSKSTTAQRTRRIWRSYQRLSLRLRNGSATMDPIQTQQVRAVGPPTIASHCPATTTIQTPPIIHGATIFREGVDTFLAICGHDFELYVAGLDTAILPERYLIYCSLIVFYFLNWIGIWLATVHAQSRSWRLWALC